MEGWGAVVAPRVEGVSLQGRVALVTGGSRGIGAACVRALARAGAVVAVNYRRRPEDAARVVGEVEAQGGRAFAVPGDAADPAGVEAVVRQVEEAAGGVDVLVLSHLHRYAFDPARRARAWEEPWEAFDEQWRSAVGSAHAASRAVLPGMRARQWGRIVLVATNLVSWPVVPYHAYVTAKAALVGFARSLAADAGPWGVTVNCVAPGLVYPTGGSARTPEALKDRLAELTPLRRVATPEDVAGAVLFFASDLSRFVTGQCLHVDGGLAGLGPTV